MADIFVSYASADRNRISVLVELLEAEGWSVWWDRELVAGASFEAKIQSALDEAKCIVVAWSNSAIGSAWCRDEAQEGLDRDILVPLCIDDVRPPLGFRSSQTASLAGWPNERAGLDRLLLGIRECVGTGTVPTTPHNNATKTAIAVIPFRNLSNDPEQEFFSEGIAEDILNELAKSTNLTVRPSSSSFLFKESNPDSRSIGRQLNVTHVLEGAVRRAGTQVRVTVRLIDVAHNQPIWSERYDHELDDVFAVQDTIAGEIFSALSMKLELRHTDRDIPDPEAYDSFLRGRFHFNRANYAEAERWFATAIEASPSNAEAWAMRGQVNAFLSANGILPNIGPNRQLRQTFIQQSLSIDESNVTALANRALMDTHYVARDYQAALDELAELRRLHPNNEIVLMYLTFVLSTLGQADLVHRVTQELIRLSPFSANAWMVRVYWGGLLFGPVEQAVVDLSEMDRLGLAVPLVTAEVALANGDRLNLTGPEAPDDWPPEFFALASATEAYSLGNYDQAAKTIAPLKRTTGYVQHFITMRVALLERNLDLAFTHLRSAVDAAEQSAIATIHGSVLLRRMFPEFYSDPRYEQLLRDIRLDTTSIAAISMPELGNV